MIAASTTPAEAELLDEGRAAHLCGISARTLRRRVNEGRVPAPRRIGRLIRWSRRELLAWIDAGCPQVANGREEAHA